MSFKAFEWDTKKSVDSRHIKKQLKIWTLLKYDAQIIKIWTKRREVEKKSQMCTELTTKVFSCEDENMYLRELKRWVVGDKPGKAV